MVSWWPCHVEITFMRRGFYRQNQWWVMGLATTCALPHVGQRLVEEYGELWYQSLHQVTQTYLSNPGGAVSDRGICRSLKSLLKTPQRTNWTLAWNTFFMYNLETKCLDHIVMRPNETITNTTTGLYICVHVSSYASMVDQIWLDNKFVLLHQKWTNLKPCERRQKADERTPV